MRGKTGVQNSESRLKARQMVDVMQRKLDILYVQEIRWKQVDQGEDDSGREEDEENKDRTEDKEVATETGYCGSHGGLEMGRGWKCWLDSYSLGDWGTSRRERGV